MNKKELAQHIGIGKTTLYNRANKFDIDLNQPLTDEEIIALRNNVPVKNSVKTEILQPTSENRPNTFEQLSEQITDNRPNTSGQSSEQLFAQNEQLSEQINKLFEQLSAKDEQIKNKDIQLSKAHETITTNQKLLDQSQQLQLDLQQQLSQSEQNKSQLLIENKELSEHLQEKNKTFWQKLFRFD